MLNTKNFEYYINEFSNYMLLEKNLSINTINSYKKDILQLENYVLIKFKNKINIEDILSKEIFEKYLIYLYDREYKPSTLARKLSSLKSFVLFLEDEKVISANPIKYLKFPIPISGRNSENSLICGHIQGCAPQKLDPQKIQCIWILIINSLRQEFKTRSCIWTGRGMKFR